MRKLLPSFPKHLHNYDFKPTDIVYVPVLEPDSLMEEMGIGPMLCDQAFVSERDARLGHFWFCTKGMKAYVQEMTVLEFLQTHNWRGMNPFETLNKFEFLTAYREKYPEIGLSV